MAIPLTFDQILETLPVLTPEHIADRVTYDAVVGTRSVPTVPTRVFDTNLRRIMLVVVNESPSMIRVGFDGNISATSGWPIFPNGGTLTLSVFRDLTIVSKPLYAVAEATATLSFMEIVKVT